MTRRSLAPLACTSLVALVLTACGGAMPAFSSRFPDNSPSGVDQILRRIGNAAAPETPAIAVGIGSAPTRLYAFDLESQRVLWSEATNARFAPIVTGDYVMTQETGGIVARDLRTGAERFVLDDDGMTLNGASAYKRSVAVVKTRGNGVYAESTVTFVEGTSVQWERSLRFTAGSPAVVGDVVLVPWGNQNITALDALSGDEFARVRVTDSVIGHVLPVGNQVFAAGLQGFFPLTAKVVSGRAQEGSYFAHQERDLPGRPKLIRDAYALSPMPAADSAEHRIRLSWEPALDDSGQVTVTDHHLYMVFYRFVFALNPDGTSASWVYTHESDIVGSAAQAGGVVIADDAGGLTFLSAQDGRRAWTHSSGIASSVVSFGLNARVDGGSGNADAPPPVREQLFIAAQDHDARLVPGRVLAVRMLAALDDAEATPKLIELCDDARLPSPVRTAACESLGTRTQGGDAILAALGRHASFLDGTSAPPIGAFAGAAVAAGVPGVASALVAHLTDPSTASRDLPALISALSALNDAAAGPALADFLRLYHADAEDEHMITALKLTVDAVVKLALPNAMEVLSDVAGDALANFAIREHARLALDRLEALAEEQAAAAEREANAAEGNNGDTAEPTPTEAEDAPTRPTGPPARLTLALVEQTLLPVRTQLRACLKSGERVVHSARIVLVVEDGSLLSVSVVPQSTQACLEPIIRGLTFPTTLSTKRERINYTLNER